MRVAISEQILDITFIIVPKLSRDCIIGADVLGALDAIIYVKQGIVVVTTEKGPVRLMCVGTAEEERIQVIEKNEEKKDHAWGTPQCTEKDDIAKEDAGEPTERKVIRRYRQLFRKRPGLISTYAHRLNIKKKYPFRGHCYAVPIAHRERVEKEIKRMLALGIIRRSCSAWTNPMVVTCKKDGTVRLCLDARRLNQVMEEDRKCPQSMDEIFQRCTGVKVMTSFDLTSSFWQIPLEKNYNPWTRRQNFQLCRRFIMRINRHTLASEDDRRNSTTNADIRDDNQFQKIKILQK